MRDYGEIFEKATQDAYLAQGQKGSCPDGKTLSQALDQAEAALNAAFPRQP
jgi:predicted RNase H-like HicB family nuclease